MAILTPRWTPLRKHEGQLAYTRSRARFNVLPCGRRSGKTEKAKRKLVRRAIAAEPGARFFAGAPTRDQAKRIWWNDLKALVPDWLKLGDPKEGPLIIPMINGVELHVLGLDKPARIEGSPWDGGVLDEFANMKREVLQAHVRPALSDRLGWLDLIGVPEGRNHYYDTWKFALASMAEHGPESEWAGFTWFSSTVLPHSEVESARRDMDDLTFRQEYEASFLSFAGRAYYAFEESKHQAKLEYNPVQPLVFCFDFNVSPGVAAICQEQKWKGGQGTGVIGEVYIPNHSNTPLVCKKLIEDWGDHQGHIYCYGDATGGARGTAQESGSDWDLIRRDLRAKFGDRMRFRVKDSNPTERARVNSVNSRLLSSDGTVQMMVDPSRAPHVVNDFEGVRALEGSGAIDKKSDIRLSHISDAVGYYTECAHPVRPQTATTVSWKW